MDASSHLPFWVGVFRCNNVAALSLVLEHGADLELLVSPIPTAPPGGANRLTFAIQWGHAEAVKILLDYGANPARRYFVDDTRPFHTPVSGEFTPLEIAHRRPGRKDPGEREKHVIEATKRACTCLIAIRKFRTDSLLSCLPKDVVILIAKSVWKTRNDATCWSIAAQKQNPANSGNSGCILG